ncbi:MAG: hypothetical protein ACR2HM_10235, partial [Acidimicrobiales bacterium]
MARPLKPACVVAAVLAFAVLQPALAHEPRASGVLRFVVGWGDEPAYTGFRNGVQVTVSDAAGGAPVTDTTGTLKVEVAKGSEKTTLPLEANFGESPGEYRAWLTPTRPGSYTFRLTGSVRGQPVDESFSSSPTTFDEVADSTVIQFPAKDPTIGQLATRLDREVPRLAADAEALGAELRATTERAASARRIDIGGAIATAFAVLTAFAALAVAARRRAG